MSDALSYGQLIPGIYGTPTAGGTDSDPIKRAALQEATAAQMRTFTTKPGYVPPSYQGDAIGPTYTQLGNGALPRIGWTCQKDAGTPVFAPYDGSHIGRIPDWTSDANAIGAGSDDMNEVFTGAFPPNRLGVAPVGDGLLQFDDQRTNPNAPTTDVSGTIDLEY